MKLISNDEYAALHADLAAARAEANRQRERAEKADARAETEIEARRSITRQHAELDAAITRLTGRNKALGERLAEAQVAGGFNPGAAKKTAERIATLQKAAAAGREDAAPWQPGYQAPTPDTKASAS